MFVDRTDVATLQPARRIDGRLVAEALITKPGVFEYADAKYPGGIRRELRPDAEVYSRETMDSLVSMPCTLAHPPTMLTPAIAKRYMVGSTGEKVSREKVGGDVDWLRVAVMVADGQAIRRMDAGDSAVSVGYKCEIEERSGVDPKYGRFDVVQTKIRGNHLAVGIPEGRAGNMARVRMDDIATYADLEYSASIPTMIVMTSVDDGHQHTIDPTCDAGYTSGAIIDGQDCSHSHEFVRTVDGSIRISENAGHAHTIDATTLGVRNDSVDKFGMGRPAAMVAADKRNDSKTGGVAARSTTLGGSMEPEKYQETVRTLEAGLKSKEAEVTQLTTRADAAESDRDKAVGRNDQLEKEITALRVEIAAGAHAAEAAAVQTQKARADAAEEKVARFDERFDAAVRKRTTIMHNGHLVMGPEFRMDDLSDRAITCAMVKRMDSTADVSDSVPDGVIFGMCDQLLKRKMSRAREDARASDILGQTTNNANAAGRTDSKAEKMKAYRDQGKQPLSTLLGKKGA